MIFLINVWQNDIQPLKQVSVVIPIKLHAELNHKYFKLMCGLAKIMVKLNDDFQNLGLTSKSIDFLNTALKTNSDLEELYLMGNSLDEAGIRLLLRITKNDKYRLHTVDVSD